MLNGQQVKLYYLYFFKINNKKIFGAGKRGCLKFGSK